ncbi:MAG: methyltransferase domain-containing protein [Bacteroidetes bacterium]|nr:methyltransferase domain-containing protein [Bacteroidota bacterium]
MEENKLNSAYWQNRYEKQETGWDIGEISTPIKSYIDQLKDKSLKILIPGAGKGYEGKYLFQNGFSQVTLLDFAELPLLDFAIKNKNFPENQLIQEDFFQFSGQFDLIIEQTMFCAIDPSLRTEYARKVHSLLNPGGRLVGVLFNRQFEGGPPFGGSKDEYLKYFEPYFQKIRMEECYNSIAQRAGSELFIRIEK